MGEFDLLGLVFNPILKFSILHESSSPQFAPSVHLNISVSLRLSD